MRSVLTELVDKLSSVTDNGEEMDTSTAVITFIFVEVDEEREKLPPNLPVGNCLVVPSKLDFQTLSSTLGDTHLRRPKYETNAEGLEYEKDPQRGHGKA